ncbi:MAG: PIG-L deacetylase family protein [Armatimonadota bacterium]
MNIVILGAHPDDPETGCGGLSTLAAKQGHRVIWAYLSSGIPGAKIGDRPEDEVREEEARAAATVCGAEPHFMRYPCSDIPFNLAPIERISNFIRDVDADLVLTHWPVDTHPDHQAVGGLGTQIVVGNPEVALAYYEVCGGFQTLAFSSNRFIDITDAADQKLKAVNCHGSQQVEAWWHYHDIMERHRYLEGFGEMGKKAGRAEGYHLIVSTPEAEKLFSIRSYLATSGSRTTRKVKHERVSLYPHGMPEDVKE